jgi:type VI protein secretion system component Hcp
VSPFKITKKIDKTSPKLVASTIHPHSTTKAARWANPLDDAAAFNTNQVGSRPDVFEVVLFFRLANGSSSPYTIIRLHHAILSEYQVVVQGTSNLLLFLL